jgi:hypothetical protein
LLLHGVKIQQFFLKNKHSKLEVGMRETNLYIMCDQGSNF